MATLQEVQELLAQDTPEIKAYKSELIKGSLNVDTVKDFLSNNEEGKKYHQSVLDATVTKGIETYKTKTLPKVIDDEITKRFPQATPEQKELQALKAEFEKVQAEAKREKLLTKALQHASTKGIPTKFLDKFLADDEENTLKNLDEYVSVFNEAVKQSVEGKFKQNGREITEGDPAGKQVVDVSKMTSEEFLKNAHLLKL